MPDSPHSLDHPARPPATAVLTDLVAVMQRLAGLGADVGHAGRLLRAWVQARPLDQGRQRIEHYLPARLRADLPGLWPALHGLARLRSRHPSAAPDDGAGSGERLLVDLHDGATVEAVLLPRGGLCVSSQVGCAVGCGFCMTGRGGLLRQLGSAEIVAQVALARSLRPVSKVVFMGMGEPAHNLDAVWDAIQLLGTHGGIAHEKLVFSTVGDPRAFERLGQGRVRPALALSLHSTDRQRRRALLPRAPDIEPADLVAAADAHARATGYPAQVQWTLLAGVNDGDDEIEALVVLMRGRKAMLNLIPWNQVDGLPFARPAPAAAAAMARRLNAAGVYTRLRQSAAQDVDGGCGQLRARHVALPRRGTGRRAEGLVLPDVGSG